MPRRPLSALLGLLDPLANAYLRATARSPGFFHKGWGERETARARVLDSPRVLKAAARTPAHITAGKERAVDGPWIAAFDSPLPDYVAACPTVYMEVIAPDHVSSLDELEGERVVVHLAATGDEGFQGRRGYAKALLKHGIASLILEIPFYGQRRTDGQLGASVETVDRLGQQVGCMAEAASVLKMLQLRNVAAMGVVGVSFGGSMAAWACLVADVPFLACTAMAPADGPAAAFVSGVMSGRVEWDKLGDKSTAREELAEQLATVEEAILGLLDDFDPTRRIAYTQLTARHDWFVGIESGERLFESMVKVDPEAKLKYLDGGHVTMFVFESKRYVAEIVESMDRITQVQASRVGK